MTAQNTRQFAGASRLIGLALTLVGLLDSAYLSWLHYGGGRAALCTAGGGCDIVQSSVYSAIAGIPVSMFGVAGYVVILLGLLLHRQLGEWGAALLLAATVIGTLFSAYLTYLELFVLHAICPYCVVSAVVMVGLLVVAAYRFGASWSDESE